MSAGSPIQSESQCSERLVQCRALKVISLRQGAEHLKERHSSTARFVDVLLGRVRDLNRCWLWHSFQSADVELDVVAASSLQNVDIAGASLTHGEGPGPPGGKSSIKAFSCVREGEVLSEHELSNSQWPAVVWHLWRGKLSLPLSRVVYAALRRLVVREIPFTRAGQVSSKEQLAG